MAKMVQQFEPGDTVSLKAQPSRKLTVTIIGSPQNNGISADWLECKWISDAGLSQKDYYPIAGLQLED